MPRLNGGKYLIDLGDIEITSSPVTHNLPKTHNAFDCLISYLNSDRSKILEIITKFDGLVNVGKLPLQYFISDFSDTLIGVNAVYEYVTEGQSAKYGIELYFNLQQFTCLCYYTLLL